MNCINIYLDMDSIIYASCYQESLDDALKYVDEKIEYIKLTLERRFFIGYETYYTAVGANRGNFRKEVDANYKANRPKEKPPLLNQVIDHLHEHGMYRPIGEEADDFIADQVRSDHAEGIWTCIVSIDKDYNTIPNTYIFNYNHNSLCWNTEWMASRFFWTQMVVGDGSDNVKGIEGLGAKKAASLLKGKRGDYSHFRAVYAAYLQAYGDNAREAFKNNYRLLKLG